MTHPSASPAPDDARMEAIRRITAASEVLASITKNQTDVEIATAKDELALAVGAARDLDVSWQTIGDALGIRRGAAYQRFRQRPRQRRFGLHQSPIDGVVVLAVRGELDALTVPQLSAAIHESLPEVPMGLIVDLDELTFLSTSGMTALVEGNRAARSMGKRFGVVTDNPSATRPMALMGIDRMVRLYPTVHAAMRGLHQLADGGRPT